MLSCKQTHLVKCSSDPRKDEREGWIWRLHGAMNGMRTGSRDFTESLAGILTELFGFQTWHTGAMSLCMSRTKHVWYPT